MPRLIVALCGQRRVGKDTVADHLCEMHAFSNMKVSGPLKQGLVQMFGFTQDQVEGSLKDEVDHRWGVSPRRAMQWLGTDVFQHRIHELLPDAGRLFWMRQLVQRIQATTGHIVISDIRFQHELDFLAEHMDADAKLVTVRLVRRCGVPAPLETDAHESESCQTLHTDFTLRNDDTQAAVFAKMDELLLVLVR